MGPREDDLKEGFPVSHDNFFKSINSFTPCCESYFYFLLIEALTKRVLSILQSVRQLDRQMNLICHTRKYLIQLYGTISSLIESPSLTIAR